MPKSCAVSFSVTDLEFDLSQGFSLTVGESVHSVGDLALLISLEVEWRSAIWLDLAALTDLQSRLCICFLQLH